MSADSPNPFVRYRQGLDTYRDAIARGLSDADYCSLAEDLNQQVAGVAGVGFAVTPLIQLDTPLERPVLAKIETANVGGSHKARHLFGLLLQLVIDEQLTGEPDTADLAIASCGNAAIGAANVAAAVGRTLRVFVPEEADPRVLAELARLGAHVEVCRRQAGELGDPCIRGLDDALASGAKPFTVQGTICSGVIDGGRTLGLELADQVREQAPADIYIQVGGGALGGSVMDGLARGGFGVEGLPMPRLHPVQPANAHPFVAAWERIVALAGPGGDLDAAIDRHPDAMTPWPNTPTSVASGILDDITYDWVALMHHQVRSGGWPVLVPETVFEAATRLAASQVAPPPDATGAAGLAGLLADPRGAETDRAAIVLITGVDRALL